MFVLYVTVLCYSTTVVILEGVFVNLLLVVQPIAQICTGTSDPIPFLNVETASVLNTLVTPQLTNTSWQFNLYL